MEKKTEIEKYNIWRINLNIIIWDFYYHALLLLKLLQTLMKGEDTESNVVNKLLNLLLVLAYNLIATEKGLKASV